MPFPPSVRASTSRCAATTTRRGWRRRATPRTRGRCSAPSPTPPTASSCSPTSPVRRSATTPRSSRRRPPPCRSSPTGGSPSAWAAARTSTSTSSGRAGRRWHAARHAAGGHPDHPRAAHRRARGLEGRLLRGRLRADLGHARRSRSPIATAVSGERSVDAFAPLADHLIAVEPDKELVDAWHDARRGTGLPGDVRVIGQIPICWDPDRDAAVAARARPVPLVRRRLGGERRPADDGGFRRRDPVRAAGGRRRGHPVRTRPRRDRRRGPRYWEAGFTDIALVQVGDEGQDAFLKEAAAPLLEKLRTESH